MLVRRVIDDQIDDHAHAALLRAVREFDEVAERAVAGIDAVVVGRCRSRRRGRARAGTASARWR